VARYNGSVAQLYYHSNSGGHTENSEDVWLNAVPYARATPDPMSVAESLLSFLVSRENGNGEFPAKWLRSHTRQEIENMLRERASVDVGTVLEIVSTEKSEGGRHLELLVRGTAGEAKIVRGATRSAFNLPSSLYNIIPVHQRVRVASGDGTVREVNVSSSLYAISAGGIKPVNAAAHDAVLSNGQNIRVVSKIPSGFSFDGRGWGHGVGMSQWGAFEMAKAGYNYQEILQYYFKGISVD